MKIRIEKGERYPVYSVVGEDEYGCLALEVSQEQIDKWNKALDIFNEMQNELETLYDKYDKFNFSKL